MNSMDIIREALFLSDNSEQLLVVYPFVVLKQINSEDTAKIEQWLTDNLFFSVEEDALLFKMNWS